jgi:predicted amidohydrolase
MTSGADIDENLSYISTQVTGLAKNGASLVVTPENALMFGNRSDYHSVAEPIGEGQYQSKLSQLARDNAVWLLLGSFPIRTDAGVTTTSLLYDPNGQLAAHYDKLHMFDVDVEDSHQRYRESETFTPGNEVVTCPTGSSHIGLTICYDVRFPALYQQLVEAGANLIVVPAAFTAVTGKAHWEPLLRARAIETQSWLVAVNQVGIHPCGRETWGHSMVISPWGEVTASLGDEKGNLLVEVDLSQVDELRKAMPISRHNRFSHQLI